MVLFASHQAGPRLRETSAAGQENRLTLIVGSYNIAIEIMIIFKLFLICAFVYCQTASACSFSRGNYAAGWINAACAVANLANLIYHMDGSR